MTFFHDTAANVNYLASVMPLPTVVAHGWLRAEGQAVNNPTNPLNILYYHRLPQTGSIGRFATYATPNAGLRDAASLIHRLSYYAGVRRAIERWRLAKTHANVVAVARAIEASPWAAGHYGGGPGRNGTIVRYVLAHLLSLPPTQPTYYRVVIDSATKVYDAANGKLIGTVTRATYTCSRFTINNQWWYRVVAPATSALYHRWLPASPSMTVTRV